MVFVKYGYPLPNNGSGYSFTEQELVKLLDSVYDKGFKDGVQVATPPEITCASSANTNLVISLRNDTEIDWASESPKRGLRAKCNFVDEPIRNCLNCYYHGKGNACCDICDADNNFEYFELKETDQ